MSTRRRPPASETASASRISRRRLASCSGSGRSSHAGNAETPTRARCARSKQPASSATRGSPGWPPPGQTSRGSSRSSPAARAHKRSAAVEPSAPPVSIKAASTGSSRSTRRHKAPSTEGGKLRLGVSSARGRNIGSSGAKATLRRLRLAPSWSSMAASSTAPSPGRAPTAAVSPPRTASGQAWTTPSSADRRACERAGNGTLLQTGRSSLRPQRLTTAWSGDQASAAGSSSTAFSPPRSLSASVSRPP